MSLRDRITIVHRDHRDIDPSHLDLLTTAAIAKHLVSEVGAEDDFWAGDGWLVPTRTTDDRIVYTYIPEED